MRSKKKSNILAKYVPMIVAVTVIPILMYFFASYGYMYTNSSIGLFHGETSNDCAVGDANIMEHEELHSFGLRL